MEKMVSVKWKGHSCFKIQCGDASLVIDPYDSVQGYPKLEVSANMTLCSHSHGDHGYKEAVQLVPYAGETPFEVRVVKSFHDDGEGSQRGENLIHVIKAAGLTLVHLGDLGHLLTPGQLDEIGPCDLVMVPVGGYYTIDGPTAKKVCDSLDPTVVIPMHYRRGPLGFDVISGPEAFLDLYPKDMVRETGEDTFNLTAQTPKQVAVLTFKG